MRSRTRQSAEKPALWRVRLPRLGQGEDGIYVFNFDEKMHVLLKELGDP